MNKLSKALAHALAEHATFSKQEAPLEKSSYAGGIAPSGWLSRASAVLGGTMSVHHGDFGSNMISGYGQRQAASLGAKIARAHPAVPRGNPAIASNLERQGQIAVQRGRLSPKQFYSRLGTSLARHPAQTVAAPAGSSAHGFGGSGSTGSAPRTLGAPSPTGTYTAPNPGPAMNPQPVSNFPNSVKPAST